MSEEWKPLVWRTLDVGGRYEVSNRGRIRSKTMRPRILEPSVGSKGYMQVCVTSTCGKRATVKVHRAVTETFIGPLKDGETVNHIDGVKINNELQNLEVVSNKENIRHSHRVIDGRSCVMINGERMGLAEALEIHGDVSVSFFRAYSRINRHGWDVIRAITTPPMRPGRPRKADGKNS